MRCFERGKCRTPLIRLNRAEKRDSVRRTHTRDEEFSFVERYKARHDDGGWNRGKKKRFEAIDVDRERRRGEWEKENREGVEGTQFARKRCTSPVWNACLFIGFCVVQRPRQSHQYIREGEGKRVSFDNLVFSRPKSSWKKKRFGETNRVNERSGGYERLKIKLNQSLFLHWFYRRERSGVFWIRLNFNRVSLLLFD